MKIEGTENYEGFELRITNYDDFMVKYSSLEIGFDREQAQQIVAVLTHYLDTGELPE